MTPEIFQRMARYNRWANRRLFEACAGLDDGERKRDRDAFFKSIHGTLNHILVADRIWLSRLNGQPHGIKSLDQILFDDFDALREAREMEDGRIIDVADSLTEDKLQTMLRYTNMTGEPQETRRDIVYTHIFNHQAHHRGQVHCLLSQAGIDPPSLDLIIFMREA
jgi:uncharacterized damage-inducible protein DinB